MRQGNRSPGNRGHLQHHFVQPASVVELAGQFYDVHHPEVLGDVRLNKISKT